MRTILLLVCIVITVFSCKEETTRKTFSPVGTWQSHTNWENNKITITVRPDSVMLFKAEKSFCPGTKFFVGVGKWVIVNDSILEMRQFTDGRRYKLEEIFPELIQTQRDSANVMALDMSVRLLMNDSHLYDINPQGKRNMDRYYDKIK